MNRFSVQCLVATVMFAMVFVSGVIAVAQTDGKRCVVADPARSALTVRTTPAGGDAGRLRNGESVRMLDIAYDEKGRAWARVSADAAGGKAVAGWVFREFLICD